MLSGGSRLIRSPGGDHGIGQQAADAFFDVSRIPDASLANLCGAILRMGDLDEMDLALLDGFTSIHGQDSTIWVVCSRSRVRLWRGVRTAWSLGY